MIIQTASVTMHFKPLKDMKRTYFSHDDALKGGFQEAAILPVPDDAPLDYPRIIIISKGGHSQLTLTSTTATLLTNFDGGYERNWSKGRDYILDKMTSVTKFLYDMGVDAFLYVGFVTTLLMDEIEEKPEAYLHERLLKSENSEGMGNLEDIVLKYTFVKEDKYYVNMQVQNARIFPVNANPLVAGDFGSNNLEKENVGVVLDINDRYKFNNNLGYTADGDIFEQLAGIMTEMLDDNITYFLEINN